MNIEYTYECECGIDKEYVFTVNTWDKVFFNFKFHDGEFQSILSASSEFHSEQDLEGIYLRLNFTEYASLKDIVKYFESEMEGVIKRDEAESRAYEREMACARQINV